MFLQWLSALYAISASMAPYLKQYRIDSIRGYFYIPLLKKHNIRMKTVNGSEATLDLTKLGRTDATIITESVGWNLIGRKWSEENDNFSTAEKPFSKEKFHLIASRDYPDAQNITENFNVDIKHIIENGVHANILKKYYIF